MNDTFREYTSYGKVVLPLLRFKRTIRPDLVCWGGRSQYFLFFGSPSPKDARKLVVYLHGGGWNSNSPRQHDFVGHKIAKEGYDCVMLGYRKVPKVRYEDIAEDVFTGYVKCKEYLASKGLHYDRIVASGSSAGGHLAALLCFDEERKAAHGIAKDEFSGLLSMAGPLCFSYSETGSLNALLKGLFKTKDKRVWEQGEPIRKLQAGSSCKVRLIQSRHDGLVGFEQAEAFLKKAGELGADAKLYEVKDAWNTHSLYCVGAFLLERKDSQTLQTALDVIDEI